MMVFIKWLKAHARAHAREKVHFITAFNGLCAYACVHIDEGGTEGEGKNGDITRQIRRKENTSACAKFIG